MLVVIYMMRVEIACQSNPFQCGDSRNLRDGVGWNVLSQTKSNATNMSSSTWWRGLENKKWIFDLKRIVVIIHVMTLIEIFQPWFLVSGLLGVLHAEDMDLNLSNSYLRLNHL